MVSEWDKVENKLIDSKVFFSSIQKFFKQIPKSNGRYKLEMVSDTKIVLSANEYNIGENQYDKINIYKIDKNQRLKIQNDIIIDSVSSLKNSKNEQFKKLSEIKYDDIMWIHIDFNYRNALLKQRKYREAIALALDIDSLISDIEDVRKSGNFIYDFHDSYLEWTHKYLPELSRKILSSLDGVVEKDVFFIKITNLLNLH